MINMAGSVNSRWQRPKRRFQRMSCLLASVVALRAPGLGFVDVPGPRLTSSSRCGPLPVEHAHGIRAIPAAIRARMGFFVPAGLAWQMAPTVASAADIADPMVNTAFNCFWAAVSLALIKNNLIDGNGPLAGVLGMEVRTCKPWHILLKTQEEAQSVLSEMKGKGSEPTLQDFEDLASERSICPSGKKAGNLGLVDQQAMVPAFDAALFDDANAEGVVIGPVMSEFGYHLIWITERSPAKVNA